MKITKGLMMKKARILAFGDSLVVGTYDTMGGWCDRLKQDMHRLTAESTDGTKYQLYNLGIGGETSRGLRARIAGELSSRHSESWPEIVIIATGKNDSRLTDGTTVVTPEEFRDNLGAIIAEAQAVTNRVVLVGIGTCAEDVVEFKNHTYTRERLYEYNEVVSVVAREHQIHKIEIHDMLLRSSSEVFYRDGLHLSDQGYQLVYEAVKPVIGGMLEG